MKYKVLINHCQSLMANTYNPKKCEYVKEGENQYLYVNSKREETLINAIEYHMSQTFEYYHLLVASK